MLRDVGDAFSLTITYISILYLPLNNLNQMKKQEEKNLIVIIQVFFLKKITGVYTLKLISLSCTNSTLRGP